MSGRLLEIAVRPVRIAFLLGRNPSNRLLNSVISVNSGMWGGVYNFICPTDGSAVTDDYLEFLKNHSPDCIALCGKFNDRQNVIHQLDERNIRPCFLYKRSGLNSIERLGIGIEGIFDSRFLQSIRRGRFWGTAIVDPRLTNTTIFDKVTFGIPPYRLKKYIETRVDFITVTRYKKESRRDESDYDELVGIIEITGENLKDYRTVEGRRLLIAPYQFRRLYCVVGSERSLEDACYFWNLRAISGIDRVMWVSLNDLELFLKKREVAHSRMVTMTSASERYRENIKSVLGKTGSTERSVRYSDSKDILRSMPNSAWQSELKREHVATDDGEFVISVGRPSSFEIVSPQHSRWVMDLRFVRDDAIGTQGFILPDLPYLCGIVAPTQSTRLRPRMFGDVFSLQIASGRIDEHIRFKIPSDWEVIEAIFAKNGYRICLSDQGNYMRRALALFGGLSQLSALLRDARAVAIFDEFVRHHRTGERMAEGNRYRRALTLDDMRRVVASLVVGKSRKKKEENFRFVEQLIRELIRLGAMHSGYMLDCSQCGLEEWYPIDEVAEDFRCRRCLARETRPLSPPVFFRLNEALYQAYAHNFAVPTLVLDVLHKFSNTSFIFSPQIKLDETDEHSHEIDIVALCDGELIIGEAKSTDKIKTEQIDTLESTGIGVNARRIVLGTTSRHSCHGVDCNSCSKNVNYADNAFSYGSTEDPSLWGTRERIADLRSRLSKQGVQVTSICPEDILQGAMLRNRPRRKYVHSGWHKSRAITLI